jgi:hypothetical protein
LSDDPFMRRAPIGPTGWATNRKRPAGAREHQHARLQNEAANGVWLRGSGLRQKRGGRKRKAFKQLEEHDAANGTTLHKRTYHPDTYRNHYGYINKLTSNARFALQEAPEACSDDTTLRGVLSAARANLRAGSFGVEQPGH